MIIYHASADILAPCILFWISSTLLVITFCMYALFAWKNCLQQIKIKCRKLNTKNVSAPYALHRCIRTSLLGFVQGKGLHVWCTFGPRTTQCPHAYTHAADRAVCINGYSFWSCMDMHDLEFRGLVWYDGKSKFCHTAVSWCMALVLLVPHAWTRKWHGLWASAAYHAGTLARLH
jgi:hypothetical protein